MSKEGMKPLLCLWNHNLSSFSIPAIEKASNPHRNAEDWNPSGKYQNGAAVHVNRLGMHCSAERLQTKGELRLSASFVF